MIALDLDIAVSLPNDRLALVHPDDIAICVKIVQAGLEQTHSVAVYHDDQIILPMKLGDFDGGTALVQAHFRVRQAGRNHGYGAVVTEPEKSARGQENLRFTNLSIERLTRLQFRRTYRLTLEPLPSARCLPFPIFYTSRPS